MSIVQLKEAVEKLSADELTEFAQWFDEFQEAQWDRQIEEDLKVGKLDALIHQAEKDFTEGKCREI